MNVEERSQTQTLLRQQSILAKFGELALRSNDLDEILTEACHLVGKALGTDLAKVVELQKDGRTLIVRAGVGWKPGVVGKATIVASDDTSEGMALRTGEPMISPDVSSEKRFDYPPFLIDDGVEAVANVIILGSEGNPPFGILQIDSRVPRQFTEADTMFLRGYANLVAAAVDRMKMIENLRKSDAQLRHAQKMEAVGRLAAGVAHDFNNILQSVIAGLELVLDEAAEGTPMHEFADIALRSAARGSSLTSHLLSYARKQMLQPKDVDVSAFLSEMQRLLSRTLGQHIPVDVAADAVLPNIHVDPGQLQTALLNLAINASHAMPAGGTLTLQAREDEIAGQRCAVIVVTDTGAGMDQATLAQVFEPFFSTKGPDGSGLGLSMVQGFAQQSGGDVRIESAPGKGTTVEVWLPAAPASDISVDKDQELSGKLQASGRILLVDDTADVLAMVGIFLERVGFQVVRAGGGAEAVAILAAGERFDVLVTDYAMPYMNGVDLIRRARKIQPGLAALLISGFAEVNPSDILPEAVVFLKKPFRRQKMIDLLRQTIAETASQQPRGAYRLNSGTPR